MATTRLMALHIGKGRNISKAINDIIDYVENPQKTGNSKYIYACECDSRVADTEFYCQKDSTKPSQAANRASVMLSHITSDKRSYRARFGVIAVCVRCSEFK